MPKKKRSGRGSLRLTLLLVPLGLATVVFAGYIVYLDVQVRARFAGALWTLPAKVYASPLELYLGQDIGLQGVLTALQRQGYRRSDELDSSGTYRLRGQAVGLHSRAFNFWDGHQPDRRLRITFSGGHIKNIKPLDNGEDLALLRLDPLLIGSIYPTGHGEDRILVQLGDVPPMLPAGLIVVEDRDFLHHFGISLKGIARAAWANLRAGEVVQGGSTITQQLVKNLFLSNQQTFVRKAREALMAILLDAHYSKEAILEAYINEVYLGQAGGRAIHGFGLASYFYFNKPVQELRPHEVALLIGMVKGPSYYDPRDHPERALKRRNLVLQLFEQAGFLSHEEAQFARRQPLGVTKAGSLGTARYPAFIDLVKRQLLGRYRDQDLTSEGLRIFTTLDPTVQAAAERNVVSTIKDLESSRGLKTGTLQTAVIVTSVEGGQVLALVGGRNPEYSGFNRALDARRLIGSLMKPVVYLTALDQPYRYNLLTPLEDTPLAVKLPNGDVWRPENYEHEFHGEVPLYRALVHSYNVATARMATQLSIDKVIETLQALGYQGEPLPVPSLALGAVAMSPMQVAQIYNTLAGGGFYTPLLAIRAVTTRNGDPLNRYPLQLRRVFDQQSVYLLNWILQRVVRFGTGRSAYYVLPDRLQVAGKTGTTDKLRDSWFAGFSANRVAVVWVGRDDNQPGAFTGATGALQIWARIMRDLDLQSFEPPLPEGVHNLPLILRPAHDQGGAGAPLDRYGRNCAAAVPVPFIQIPAGLAACQSATTAPQGNENRSGSGDDSNWFLDLFR